MWCGWTGECLFVSNLLNFENFQRTFLIQFPADAEYLSFRAIDSSSSKQRKLPVYIFSYAIR